MKDTIQAMILVTFIIWLTWFIRYFTVSKPINENCTPSEENKQIQERLDEVIQWQEYMIKFLNSK